MGGKSEQGDGPKGPPLPLLLLRRLVLLLALLHGLRFLHAAACRLTLAFPLDWVEGLSTLHALNMLRGWPPYHPPHVEAVPIIYGPVMAWLILPFLALGLRGLWVARALSVAATLGTGALLHRFVRREGGTHAEGAAAACLFLAGYDALDRVLDMGRVDPVAFFLLLLGSYWITAPGRAEGRSGPAALAMLAATFCKQSLGLCCLAVLGARCLRRRREGLRALAVYVGGGILLTGLLELWSSGWFQWWILKLPRTHPFDSAKSGWMILPDLARGLPAIAYPVAALVLALRLARPRRSGPAHLAPPLLAALGLLAGYLSWMKIGGHVNGWLYAFGATALTLALLPADVRRMAGRRSSRARVVEALVLLLVAQAGLSRLTSTAAARPRPRAHALARRYARLVASMPGSVLNPVYPAITELSGGGPNHSLMPLWDLAYGKIDLEVEELATRVRGHHWAAVILPLDYAPWVPWLEEAYAPAFPVELPEMLSGNDIPDHWVWLPRVPEYQPREAELASLLGPRRAGTTRESGAFMIRSGALALKVAGGGDPRHEGIELHVGSLVRRRTGGIPGAAAEWYLWDTREFVGEDAVLRLRTTDPSPRADLRLEKVVALEVPASVRKLAEPLEMP